jgi:hypothetical protein
MFIGESSHRLHSSTRTEPRDVFNGIALLFVAHDPVVADLHAKKGAAGGDGAQMRRVALQFGQRCMTDQLDEMALTTLVDLGSMFRFSNYFRRYDTKYNNSCTKKRFVKKIVKEV